MDLQADFTRPTMDQGPEPTLQYADRMILAPGESRLIPTGLYIDVPNGHFGMVVPRSGRSIQRPFLQPNAPGIIDAGFQGEIMVPQLNISNGSAQIDHGERIAQLVLVPFARMNLSEVTKFTRSTERGESGYGSTGK